MTVSAALIVRDEEFTLPHCLDSIAGGVDELVIVDTGSVDATVEVARRYTDRIFHFDWCDDFSAARQFAFDRATGDWVCWVDADDVVIGAEHIRALAANAPPDVAGFSFRYIYERDAWGKVRLDFWRERLVRNDGSFRWSGRVHETLVRDESYRVVLTDAVVVEHRSPPERTPAKNARNLRLLEMELAASDGNPSERCLFYLGSEYATAGECDRAISTLTRFVGVSTSVEERYQARTLLAGLCRHHGDFDAAISHDLAALWDRPEWPFAYFGLAETAFYQEDWHRAILWTDLGRTRPRPETDHFFNHFAATYRWIIFYTTALWHLGAVAEALNWTAHALTLRPDDEQHRANLRLLTDAILTGPEELVE